MWKLITLMLLVAPAGGVAQVRPLDRVLAHWDGDAKGDLKGVMVLQRGRVVAERYWNGATAATLHDVRSAGKSVTALLLGIAIDRERVAGTDDPVRRYWREAAGSAIGDVRLDDVLTMRSGLAAFDEDARSPGHEDRLDEAKRPDTFILSVPRADPPGTVYRYNSVTAAVAGIVVAKTSGGTMEAFAARHLFAPLGIRRWRWDADAAGYTKGQGNLSLTLRDFAAIGEMVRRRGSYRGHRVVSRAWIDRALAPRVAIGAMDRYADHYGYFWYAKTHDVAGTRVPVSFASGNGGNKIYVVPSRGLVVAIQSAAYGKGYGQRRSEEILRAVLAADRAH